MATAPALRNQIEAIKKRIDAVAPTASPEDVVMLAKSIEAISGQATVFDVMDAGVSARNEALMLIDEAKNTALTEIVKAVGITDELNAEHVALRADMAGLFDRTDLTPLVLPPGGAVLPDLTRGVYVLTPGDYTASSVTLPDYADGSGALRSHLLINNSDMAIRVLDAGGHALGTVPARGFSLAFAVESAGVWSWRVSQSEPGSQSLIIDSPLLLLDNATTAFLSVLDMNGGFLACWQANDRINTCFLRWADGELKADPVSRFPNFPGDYFRAVKITETSALLAWRYTSDKVIRACVLSLGQDGAWNVSSPVVVNSMSSISYGHFSVAMESETSGILIIGDSDGASTPNYFSAAQRITVTGNTVAKTGGLFKIETGTASNGYSGAIYIDRYAADFRNGRALCFGGQLGSNSPHIWRLSYLNAGGLTPTLIRQLDVTLGITASDGSRTVRFLSDDLAVALWRSGNVVYWRLVEVGATALTPLAFGSVQAQDFATQFGYSRLQLFVMSEDTVACIVHGTVALYPRIAFGTVRGDRADMSWSEWTELPFITKYDGYITGAYDAAKKAFAIVEHNSVVSPLMLTAKL